MIRSFKHKGLKRLYERDDARLLPADMADRLRVILSALDAARDASDLDRPSFRLHLLKGDLKGFYAVTVRANWRIIFRFVEEDAVDVDFLDYH